MGLADYLKRGPVLTEGKIKELAASNAAHWREDCYVYISPGMIVLSPGPDADHPKTAPDFVAPYQKQRVAA